VFSLFYLLGKMASAALIAEAEAVLATGARQVFLAAHIKGVREIQAALVQYKECVEPSDAATWTQLTLAHHALVAYVGTVAKMCVPKSTTVQSGRVTKPKRACRGRV
jgi:hypothetical protein